MPNCNRKNKITSYEAGHQSGIGDFVAVLDGYLATCEDWANPLSYSSYRRTTCITCTVWLLSAECKFYTVPTMGWEWRLFVPLRGESNYQLVQKFLPERRTDVYRLVGHASLGLKQRNGKSWELKIRTQTESGWELWSKVLLQDVSDIHSPELGEELDRHLRTYLKDNPTPCDVHVYKERVHGLFNGIPVEQVDLDIKFQSKRYHYRSFSVEGSRNGASTAVCETLLQKVGPEALVVGYPAFLEQLVNSSLVAQSK